MARIKGNAFAESLSGKLGGLLMKQYSYDTVVSKMPDRTKVKLSTKQKKPTSALRRPFSMHKPYWQISPNRNHIKKK